MTTTTALFSYSTPKSFETTLAQVRKALAAQGIHVASEMDLSQRLKNELGVGLYACHVLLVDDPALLLEAMVFNRSAAEYFPQPVTVAAGEHCTHIYLRGADMAPGNDVPASIRQPLGMLITRMRRALESVASPETVATRGGE